MTAIQLTRLTMAFGAVSDVWFVIFYTRARPEYTAVPVHAMHLMPALLAGVVVAVGLFAYGAALNDVLDARHDSTFSPDRPIPAGRIRLGQAAVVTVGALMVAVVGGKIVGWCNATDRASYPKHSGGVDPSDSEVGSIVCFTVAPPYRGHGVARRLLNGACDLLQRSGFGYAEAYPVTRPPSAEAAYRGTPGLFTEAGFSDAGDGVMRKPLDPS